MTTTHDAPRAAQKKRPQPGRATGVFWTRNSMEQIIKNKPPVKRTRATILTERAKASARLAALDAELANLEAVNGGDETDTYSSTSLPPDCPSRRRFGEVCRSGGVEGAELRGHVWSCPRVAWHAARTRKRPVRVVPAVTIGNDDEQVAAAALASAGLRSTRRAS